MIIRRPIFSRRLKKITANIMRVSNLECEPNRERYIYTSGFGGLEVACWPLVPKYAGSNPAEAVGFLRVKKNPQHFGGHGGLSVVIVVCCQVEVSATN